MSNIPIGNLYSKSFSKFYGNVLKSKFNIPFIANQKILKRSFANKSKKHKDFEEQTFITSPGQDRWRTLSESPPEPAVEKQEPPQPQENKSEEPLETAAEDKLLDEEYNFITGYEKLTPEQEAEKAQLIKELTKQLRGPLADEDGNLPTGDKRPIAIEVDGPSHFYANSTNYTAYTKLKHRLLTRMGYKVLHVPYFEWRRLRGAREREEYMRAKLEEEPTEWLDPEDEKFFNERLDVLKQQFESTAAKKTNNEEVKKESIEN